MGKSLTQFDVAKAAGVSRSTVAAVLQSRSSTSVVTDKKKKLVLDAVKKLNYHPNFAAKSLRVGKTHNIAFAVPSATSFGGTITSQILIGIMARARELGYSLTVTAYEAEYGPHESFEQLVRSSRFDGFFHFGGQQPDAVHKAEICGQWRKPYVVLQRPVEGTNSIYFDDVLGGRLAMQALIKSGCKKVAIVSDHPSSFYAQRLLGALEEAKEHEIETIALPLSEDLAESGRQAIKTIWDKEEQIDGIYGGADQVALACIQELTKRGIKIPQDIAIVGHDDGPMAALATPALTSVRQDGRKLGEQAMGILHERIESKEDIPFTVRKMAPELVERESTKRNLEYEQNIDTEFEEIEAEKELVCA